MKTLDFDGCNVGGLRRVFIIPDTSIGRLAKNYQNGKYWLEIIRSSEIIELGLTLDTASATETAEPTEQGTEYILEVGGVCPKINSDNLAMYKKLERSYCHVLYTDQNGELRFARNTKASLSKTTGTDLADRNQIDIRFKRSNRCESFYIEPRGMEGYM